MRQRERHRTPQGFAESAALIGKAPRSCKETRINVCLIVRGICDGPVGFRKRFEPQLRQIFHLYWRLARGMTLGVRGVVLDADGKVF